jgi:hypothetical protein
LQVLTFSRVALAGLVLAGGTAHAGIVRIAADAFTAEAGVITFSEFAVNTVNPTYAPAAYGGGVSAPTVTFDGYFAGQSAGSTNPSACPVGAAVTGCVLGLPTGPTLQLAPGATDTFITTDGSFPTSPTLTGGPRFNGSIAILFSVDLAGVGLDGGFFNAIGGTAITAFARNGSLLGSVTNAALGIEFLGLVTDDGTEQIAGLLFSLVGPEPAGFNIDNLRFGRAGQVVVPPPASVPEPATLGLLALGLLATGVARRRR